ncbi:fimbrillin family protein [Bacteroides sp. 519]|uniref:fimbrillin family protein n=1 Tax=Bacteroides sp. 519 TaxID=2302937 RepID=UPI0013D20385|nr:fimbrillin family protein [Bacteroides sp. 519]NDV58329.1 fimbrillin family protein [Bacteroides sp. 519]
MKRIIYILITVLLTGCNREEPALPTNQYINITASWDEDAKTRGTLIENANRIPTLGVYCIYTGTTNWTTQTSYHFINQRSTNTTVGSSNNNWSFSTQQVWNHSNGITANNKHTFFAYSPYAATGNGLTASTTNTIPTVTYTVPTTVANQPDLMVATPRKDLIPSQSNTEVDFVMKHALTAVSVKVSSDVAIKTIALTGVKVTGTLNLNTHAWSLGSATTTTYYPINITGTTSVTTQSNGHLMMIPQTLTDAAKIRVTFTDGKIEDIPLKGYGAWGMGKKVVYNLELYRGNIIDGRYRVTNLSKKANTFPRQMLNPHTYSNIRFTISGTFNSGDIKVRIRDADTNDIYAEKKYPTNQQVINSEIVFNDVILPVNTGERWKESEYDNIIEHDGNRNIVFEYWDPYKKEWKPAGAMPIKQRWTIAPRFAKSNIVLNGSNLAIMNVKEHQGVFFRLLSLVATDPILPGDNNKNATFLKTVALWSASGNKYNYSNVSNPTWDFYTTDAKNGGAIPSGTLDELKSNSTKRYRFDKAQFGTNGYIDKRDIGDICKKLGSGWRLPTYNEVMKLAGEYQEKIVDPKVENATNNKGLKKIYAGYLLGYEGYEVFFPRGGYRNTLGELVSADINYLTASVRSTSIGGTYTIGEDPSAKKLACTGVYGKFATTYTVRCIKNNSPWNY